MSLSLGQASGGNESVQVVIVGAGISGLVAAWELRKRGVTDVLVLKMLTRSLTLTLTLTLKSNPSPNPSPSPNPRCSRWTMRLAATHAPATTGPAELHGRTAFSAVPQLTVPPRGLLGEIARLLAALPWPSSLALTLTLTSASDQLGGIAYPWGAHYVPLPSRGAVRTLLEELGLMRRATREAAADVGVDEDDLCPEPSERLFVRGEHSAHDRLHRCSHHSSQHTCSTAPNGGMRH